jgi:hypothetical protein
VTLREEAVEQTAEGADAVSWRWATHRWRDYVEESRESAVVFENGSGDRARGTAVNRFHPEYAAKQYAKLKDLERGLRADYGKRLHTAMLTLTASPTDGEGRPVGPVDHLDGPDGLLASWEAVRRSLNRVLEGQRFERLAILEPHKSGYIHIHIAVFVEGVVVPGQFRPVIEAHLDNCERAGREAHRIAPDDPDVRSAASVKHVGSDRGEEEIENLGTYLAEYLGAYNDPLEEPDHVQAANALLWATGKQRWRPSNGAQEYMRREEDESPSEWRAIGVEDGSGELHEFPTDEDDNIKSPGGVSRATTHTVGDWENDPPPDDGPARWGGVREDGR